MLKLGKKVIMRKKMRGRSRRIGDRSIEVKEKERECIDKKNLKRYKE